MKAKNYVGSRFGRLSVVERFPSYMGKKKTYYRCVCDCGNEVFVSSCNLGKHCNSCGCLSKEIVSERFSTHGKSNTKLFVIWTDMRNRCLKERDREYKNYGGRGVTICVEWLDFQNFHDWAIANGYDENAPRGQCTLDRIDVNGNYEPSNCRWVDMKVQSRNRRNNVRFSLNDESRTIAEWAEISGLPYSTIYYRYVIKRWSPLKTLTKPLRAVH